MLFLGVDWGERHHDLCLLDQDGSVLAARRIADGLAGWGSCTPGGHPCSRTRRRWRSGSRPTGAAGRGAGGRRLPGVCGQPAGGEPLPRPPRQLAGQVRPRRRQGAGRSGPHRPPQPPPGRWRQPAGRGGQGAGPGPSEPDLGPPAARQRAAQRPAGVLPGCAGRPGAQLAEPEALAVLALAPNAGAGPAADQGSGTAGAGRCWSAAQPASPSGGCPRRAGGAAAGRTRANRGAYREVVGALVAVLCCFNDQVAALEQQLAARFADHPDAAIIRSQPGLGVVLGAGCWASSATTPTAMPPPRAARPSPAPPRSPDPRGCAPWWSPGRRATSGWSTPATCGRSRR